MVIVIVVVVLVVIVLIVDVHLKHVLIAKSGGPSFTIDLSYGHFGLAQKKVISISYKYFKLLYLKVIDYEIKKFFELPEILHGS